jgi:hydroxypyruvate reductase
MNATSRVLDLLTELGEEDFVLSLISGGGSALLCAPAGDMSLKDKQQIHRSLLKSGAPISKMNIVRKHLSRVKGGQLAAAAYPARMLSLLISDVPGDNPADIASGASVGETSTNEDAMGIVKTYNIELPDTAKSVLMGPDHVILPGDERLTRVENTIISAPSQSLDAARIASVNQGIVVINLGDAIEGEARDEGARQVEIALSMQRKLQANQSPILLLSGGECTVFGNGGGVGGPNAEFALSCAIALDGSAQIYLIACDTDGVDGAAEVAGAIVTPDTLVKAKSVGADAKMALLKNDSHSFFASIGDQVITGPTLTNVNDFRAILIKPLET